MVTAQANTVADLVDTTPGAIAAFVESLGLPVLKAKKLLAALGVAQQQVLPSTLRTAYSQVPDGAAGYSRVRTTVLSGGPAAGRPGTGSVRTAHSPGCSVNGPRMPTRARTQQGKAALCEGSSVLHSAQAACGGVL